MPTTCHKPLVCTVGHLKFRLWCACTCKDYMCKRSEPTWHSHFYLRLACSLHCRVGRKGHDSTHTFRGWTISLNRLWGGPPLDSVLEPELGTLGPAVKDDWLLLCVLFLISADVEVKTGLKLTFLTFVPQAQLFAAKTRQNSREIFTLCFFGTPPNTSKKGPKKIWSLGSDFCR